MAISVTCPNGHALKVQESLAGKIGLCPKCRARVRVPAIRRDELSEDTILDFLGPHQSSLGDSDTTRVAPPPPAGHVSADAGSPPQKSCTKCHRAILSGTRICPHCHTYIAQLSDVARNEL